MKLLKNMQRSRFDLKKGKIFPVYCLAMNEFNRLHFTWCHEPGYSLFLDYYRCKGWSTNQHPDLGVKFSFKASDIILNQIQAAIVIIPYLREHFKNYKPS